MISKSKKFTDYKKQSSLATRFKKIYHAGIIQDKSTFREYFIVALLVYSADKYIYSSDYYSRQQS